MGSDHFLIRAPNPLLLSSGYTRGLRSEGFESMLISVPHSRTSVAQDMLVRLKFSARSMDSLFVFIVSLCVR